MKTHIGYLSLILLAAATCLQAQSIGITNHPASLSAQAGEVALFRVGATNGVSLAYSWFKDGLALADTERVSGAHADQLVICPVVAGDTGQYRVLVTDGTNNVYSQPASLAVNIVLPVFTNVPATVHITNGEAVLFSGGATGTPSIVYGWRRDGADVTNGGRFAGADSSTLILTGTLPEDTGWYALTASNTDGLVSSPPARLHVHTPSDFAAAANFDEGLWTTGGNASWFTESDYSRDGRAVSSGAIGNNTNTYLETTVYGPGDLAFYWMVSSEAGCDFLVFKLDNTEQASISGVTDWNRRVFPIGLGPRVVRWEYRKDGSIVEGLDRGFVDQVSFTLTPLVSLETALNAPPLPLLTYGDARWFGQESINHDGASAARSGSITHNQSSTLETSVSGPGWISFTWKVSSENADPLAFLVDGVGREQIAGEVDWTNRTFHIPWGLHTLSWRYQKDQSVNVGSDAAWLDQVSYTPVVLFDLAQASDLLGPPWTAGGNLPWFGQNEYSHDGVDALQSGLISHNQTSFLNTTVIGPGTGSFFWKVSSEAGSDPLIFEIDGGEVARISGEVDWTQRTFSLTNGSHTLTWRYQKDYSVNTGSDAGWIDQFSFTTTGIVLSNPELKGHSFTVSVLSVTGKSYFLEYKNDLNNPVWTPLPGVPGTGLQIPLTDFDATVPHRFYRVRMDK